MFSIVQTSQRGDVFPGLEYLYGYSSRDINEMPYILGVGSLCGMRIRMLGDSGVSVLVTPCGYVGEKEADRLYHVFVRDLVDILYDAIPQMSSLYATFYRRFAEEYELHGPVLPYRKGY